MQIPTRSVAACAVALAWPALGWAQASWINPGQGSWFDAANWSSAAVPAGGGVVVGNGGTAVLSAPPATTPQLGALFIGQSGTGTGVGTVLSNGVDIRAGFLGIGNDSGISGNANGVLRINGAGGTANTIGIGNSFASGARSDFSGRLEVSGDFLNGTSGSFVVGQAFAAARGTTTNGTAIIGGNAGAATFFAVGDAFSDGSANIGSRSAGVVRIGGSLGVSALVSVGTGFDARVADAGAPGGFRFNQTRGTVDIGGTLSITAPNVGLNIGSTGGGVADGSLTVGTLDIPAANAVPMSLGNALGRGGAAVGRLAADRGDLRVVGDTRIGHASESNAQGSLSLGGRFIGTNGAPLSVGSISSAGTVAAQAIGSVTATGGVSGFGGYSVGLISGAQAAGTTAQGSVTGGAGAPGSLVGAILVGSIFSGQGGGAASAAGSLNLGNSANVSGTLAVGEAFLAARGSSTTGALNIGGDAGSPTFFVVGDVFSGSDANVGSRSAGVARIGGNLAVSNLVNVGISFDPRIADAAAPGGFRFNQASGDAAIGGVLSIAGAGVNLNVGSTGGGVADGVLRVGAMAMGANTLGLVSVGNAFADGVANGTLEINDGLLRADVLNVGVARTGVASGTLQLNNANLQANSVAAGIGGAGGHGDAQLVLSDSTSTVAGQMLLLSGMLSLERSRLGVGSDLFLGDDALTHIEIDGLLRGTQYGAVDAADAWLDGNIEIDFADLVLGGDSAVFDILRTGNADGIHGNFDGLSFTHLDPGYAATAGIELDGGAEVFRVRLTRNEVPEPAPALLLLAVLGWPFRRIVGSGTRFWRSTWAWA